MCEKRLRLRVLVSERLTAAAEEIFALVERTIAEYEEELCRSKEENQRKQQLLDSLLSRTSHRNHTEDCFEEDFGPSLKQENLDQELEPCLQWEPEPEPSQNLPQNLDHTKPELDFNPQHSLKPEAQTQLCTNSEDATEDSAQTWDAPMNQDSTENEMFYAENDSAFDPSRVSSKESGPKPKRKQCPVCGKSFRTSNDLKRHMVVHTGEKPFSCSVCGKKFTRKGSMQYHMVVHSGDKPCSCSVCGKAFPRLSNLRTHMVLHSEDKPFSCSGCGARFSSQPPLIRHQKVHQGQRPFSCPFCDKDFSRNEHLRRHIQTHSDGDASRLTAAHLDSQ